MADLSYLEGLPPETLAFLGAVNERRQSDDLYDRVMQDPAYLLWLREQTRQLSDIEGERNIFQDRLRADQGMQHSVYAQQKDQAEEGINTASQNRGMFRSGKRLSDIYESNREIERQKRRYDLDVSRQIADRQRQASMDIAALERRDAEEQLLARERISARDAETAYMV